jgi:hypothetical protein
MLGRASAAGAHTHPLLPAAAVAPPTCSTGYDNPESVTPAYSSGHFYWSYRSASRQEAPCVDMFLVRKCCVLSVRSVLICSRLCCGRSQEFSRQAGREPDLPTFVRCNGGSDVWSKVD